MELMFATRRCATGLGDDAAITVEIPELADELVRLRRLTEADVDPYVDAFASDPALGEAIGAEADPRPEGVRARIGRSDFDAHGNISAVELAITDAATDAFLGVVVLFHFDWRHQRCELGFWLARHARRRGAARRACGLMLDWAFDTLGMRRVELTTLPESERVVALAESLGFVREGLMRSRNLERGRELDVAILGLLREEWAGRRGAAVND